MYNILSSNIVIVMWHGPPWFRNMIYSNYYDFNQFSVKKKKQKTSDVPNKLYAVPWLAPPSPLLVPQQVFNGVEVSLQPIPSSPLPNSGGSLWETLLCVRPWTLGVTVMIIESSYPGGSIKFN